MITFVTFHVDCNKNTINYLSKSCPSIAKNYDFKSLINLLFRSASIFHPDCKKVILTDKKTDWSHLDGNIEIHRFKMDQKQLMLSRLIAQINYLKNHDFSSDLILIDSDMLVNGNLESLFKNNFDIALTYRHNKFKMPINGGIIFISKNKKQKALKFMQTMLKIFKSNYYRHNAWWGDQEALIDIVGYKNFINRKSNIMNTENIKILLLPQKKYNFSPANRMSSIFFKLKNKKIIHFNGERKRFMPFYWNVYLSHLENSNFNNLIKSFWYKTFLIYSAVVELFVHIITK
jgi:hypothetical protein